MIIQQGMYLQEVQEIWSICMNSMVLTVRYSDPGDNTDIGADFNLVDWQYPSDSQQGADYILLLAATRHYLQTPTYTLTSALPVTEWVLRNIDVAVAASCVDFLNLKAYDFSGPWTDLSGHHAQLYTPMRPHSLAAKISCHSAVTYLSFRDVPLAKILLGIPMYGQSFLGVDGIGQRYTGQAGQKGTFKSSQLPRPGTQERVDVEVVAAYCVGGDGGFVSYDNSQTVRMKARYVREQKLGGLFYWTGTGDATGSRSLIENGYTTLHEQ